MGFGGIGIWELLIVLLIVVLVFGTKKLRNMGSDLGGAVGNFKRGMQDGNNERTGNAGEPDEHDPASIEQNKKSSKKKTQSKKDADFDEK